LPIRLVVVSCPATTSWKIVESISCSDSAPPLIGRAHQVGD